MIDLPSYPSPTFKKNTISNTTLPKTTTTSSPDVVFVVDVLSVGSLHRLDYIEAQKQTFGSHVSVRHFFNVTEADDADPACATNLSRTDVVAISNWCKSTKQWNATRQFVLHYLQGPYARADWLMKKANPAGWMCAQSRPVQGMYKVLQMYRDQYQRDRDYHQSSTTSSSSSSSLPDYLLIVDDDTYYNMDIFLEYLQTNPRYVNSSVPSAIAGCLVRSPISAIHLTLPFGGYGITLSKGYLEKIMRPLDCSTTTTATTTTGKTTQENEDAPLCRTIRETSHLDEGHLLVGVANANATTSNEKRTSRSMSIADIMYAYATNQPFRDYRTWTTGFCVHSDW
jgi:hypothetical protein